MAHHPLRARFGISLFFLTNGFLMANLLPRYPEVKMRPGGAFLDFQRERA